MEQMKQVTEPIREPIYAVLKTEHALVKKLFEQILSDQKWSDTIWKQIDWNLKSHMDGEEKYFYPKLADAPQTATLAREAMHEHNEAKMVQATVANAMGADRISKLGQLYDMIDHHIYKEENELFPQAKKVLSNTEEITIAAKFTANKMAKTVS